MFGIDLGINVSSITCISGRKNIVDYYVITGNSSETDNWKRIVDMAECICDTIIEMIRSRPNDKVDCLVSIEEPVYSSFNKNAKAHFTLSCLYALVRNRLTKRGFEIYSVHPLSAKSVANQFIKHASKKYRSGRNLNKLGMLKSFKTIFGHYPGATTKYGRETLADSYFIALTGVQRRRMELHAR